MLLKHRQAVGEAGPPVAATTPLAPMFALLLLLAQWLLLLLLLRLLLLRLLLRLRLLRLLHAAPVPQRKVVSSMASARGS